MKIADNIYALLFFTLFSTHQNFAQSFVPVKDEAALRNKLTESTNKLTTIQTDFVQQKNMSMISEPVTSKGIFSYKKENKVRLEYNSPSKNVMVLNNGKMMMSDGKKVTQMDMNRSKFFQQFNSIVTGSVNGSLFESKDFTVKYFESPAQIKIEMTPIAKNMKNFLSSIVMVMDKKDYTATRLEMNEPSGDNTILTFGAKKLNIPLDDTLFLLR